MAYVIKLGKTIDVPVKFKLRDGAKDVEFSFSLVLRRIDQHEAKALAERFTDDPSYQEAEFLQDHVIGWRGQRLVVDDDDQPAEFGSEAFALMQGVLGLRPILMRNCIDAIGNSTRDDESARAKAKN